MTAPAGGPAEPAISVRDIEAADLDALARLHRSAFPDSVLGQLGHEAVRRNYRWQLDGPHDLVALVAVDGPAAVGFLLGGRFRGSTIGFLKREKWFLVGRVLRHPGVLRRAAGWDRVLLAGRLLARRPARSPAPEAPALVPEGSFGVLAVAVAPGVQGRGVGQQLMAEATGRARSAGYRAMHLTVNPDNAGAVAFYTGLGWERAREGDGRWTGRMTCRLD